MRPDENAMTSSQGSGLCNRGAEKELVNVAKQAAAESGARAHLGSCGGKETMCTKKAEGSALTVFTMKTYLTFEATDMFNLIPKSHLYQNRTSPLAPPHFMFYILVKSRFNF